ncbi:lysosomal proton-coupled steroid conjugate and bile acid symporter SLC46A3-like [Haliotis asinina]|uniref:lysosomal proton-coupled steroid conjugate and bile acid symporter SLC46A3-like n=1 Tax=Haliotis asinina TaxID=109174 RepID=UPI0035321DCA
MDSVEEQPSVKVEKTASNLKEKPDSYIKGMILSTAVLILFTCANNSSIPLFTQYIHSRYEDMYSNGTHSSSTNDQSPCHGNASVEDNDVEVRVQQSTSSEILKLSLCFQLPPVFVNMVVGSYSDHIGRKMLFLLPMLGCTCKYIGFLVVVKFNLNLNFLLIGTLLEGFSGSIFTFILANMAYAADVTKTHATRTFAIVITDCSVSVAMALGQIMTGFLIQKLDYFYPSVIHTTLILLAIAIVIFGITETVKEKEVKELSPVVHLKKVFGFYVNKSRDNKRFIFIVCVIVFALLSIGLSGKTTIEILYQLGRPFCWNPVKIGYYGAYSTVFMTVSGIVAIKLGSKCVRVEVIAVIGMFLLVASLILEGLARTDAMLYSVPFVASINSVAFPVTRSVLSRMVEAHEQGAIFSSMATIDTLSAAIGSTGFASLYRATAGTMRGMAFHVIGAVIFIAAILKMLVIVKLPRQPSYEQILSPPEDEKDPNLNQNHYGTFAKGENNTSC